MPSSKHYRASRDIHSQEHPEAFSLSIKDQFFFALGAGTVSDVASGGGAASRLIPCRLARYVGDDRTAAALESIATDHPSARIRMTALESLAALVSHSARQRWQRAEKDSHPLVRLRARQALSELDGVVTEMARK